jgi:hypothetical protein
MGLFKQIDEALATVRQCQRLAAKYAQQGVPALEAGSITPDRSVEHDQPLIAA